MKIWKGIGLAEPIPEGFVNNNNVINATLIIIVVTITIKEGSIGSIIVTGGSGRGVV